MVCHRNQFGYRLFFLPLPADIFSSVFHSLNSIKKSACCYFKLLYLSFEQFIFKQRAAHPKFDPRAIWQDLNPKYATIITFSGHLVIMVRHHIYLVFKCCTFSIPKLKGKQYTTCKYFGEVKQFHYLFKFALQILACFC